MQNSTILNNISPSDLKEMLESAIDSKIIPLLNKLTGNTSDNDLLTREEACKLLSINSSTLWTYTNQGRLKAYGIGSRRYYKRSELLESLTPVSN